MNERHIFESALDIAEPALREEYLLKACGNNTALRARVDALLATNAAPSQFLETPVVQQLLPPSSSTDSVDTVRLRPGFVADDESDMESPHDTDLSFLLPSAKPGSMGVLGHYEILQILGQGGFGIVFKAFDEKLYRHVAIKTMNVQMAAMSPARKRFLREARAAAAIRHENVVQVYNVEEQPLPYLVMEFIDGETLQQKQKDQGPLEAPELLHIGRQIASGLVAAHAQSLIHRDVKPGNILIEKGVEQKVKITDFGLARTADDASLTRSGMISGTPMYMAPEQALGQTLDHRSDLFSLGSVLYELATGRPPFRAPTTLAVLKRVVDDTPRPIQEIIPEIPNWLVTIINKLMEKKPEDRYQSAKEVADLLGRCQSELQLSGKVTSVSAGRVSHVPVREGEVPAELSAAHPRVVPADGSAGTLKFSSKGSSRRKYTWIGAACLGLAILAGIFVTLRTKEGTLVVEVDQPDAVVQVLDAEGKIEVTQKNGPGTVSISVDPGKHRLKIEKEGFTIFGQDFEMQSGGQTPIKAKLVPLEEKPVMTEAKPAEIDDGQPKPLAFTMPGFEQWAEKVADLPVEQRLEEVRKKLVELNPGFDGKLEPDVKGEVVTSLILLADNVRDISPVRALPTLSSLNIHGKGEGEDQGKLVDISPLKGMTLKALFLHYTQVSDLSPLQGMRLSHLSVAGTNVSDLSPLKDIPLEILQIASTQVSDLSPLKGMKLSGLDIGSTNVTDLSPLSGMPLKSLRGHPCRFTDLSPLKGMPLELLHIAGNRVADLSPLKGMPLNELSLGGAASNLRTLVADLSPLEGMPLQRLQLDFKPGWNTALLRAIKTLESINNKPPTDFCDQVERYNTEARRPLAFEAPEFDQWVQQTAALPAAEQVKAVSGKLVELNPGFDGKVRAYEGTDAPIIKHGSVVNFGFLTDHVTDISPLRALKSLTVLDLHGSPDGQGRLINLSPLKGLPLADLTIYSTQVSDLSPLQGMPLTSLHCSSTYVADLTALYGMPLEQLICSGTIVSDITPLRGLPMKSLNFNNTLVSDLSPLQGMKLTDVACSTTQVTDLSLLREMPLRVIQIDFDPERDTTVLRSIKTLEEINGQPVGMFWRKVEAKRKPQPKTRSTLAFTTPAFELWFKEVSVLAPEQQVEAVSKKLVELNPGFDGKVKPEFHSGMVIGLMVMTDHVTDISPVRVFHGLRTLDISSTACYGMLSDLTPLKGLPLNRLFVIRTRVVDLSPLQGMPLTDLNCSITQVSDLSPLADSPLKRLAIVRTPVADLSPLRGKQLIELQFLLTRVTDVSPLRGMPLENLSFDFRPQRDIEWLRSLTTLQEMNDKPAADFWKDVAEYSDAAQTLIDPEFQRWLKDVAHKAAEDQVVAVAKKLQELNPSFDGKVEHTIDAGVVKSLKFDSAKVWNIAPVRALTGLKTFDCSGSGVDGREGKVADLSPLSGLLLTELRCVGTLVFDLSPLKGMPLNHLVYGNGPAFDLTPLEGMPLKILDFGLAPLTDLTPIHGLPLEYLFINGTHVTNFSPLRGMSLIQLHFYEVPIADLTPLAGMPLETLRCKSSYVTDLTQIKDLPIKYLYLDFQPARDAALLHSMPTLKFINDKPVSEFWKQVEE